MDQNMFRTASDKSFVFKLCFMHNIVVVAIIILSPKQYFVMLTIQSCDCEKKCIKTEKTTGGVEC